MNKKSDFYLYILLSIIVIFAFLPRDIFPKVLLMLDPGFKHFIAFFTLSVCAFYFQQWNIKKIFIFIFIFGVMIEIFQSILTSSRTFSLVDLFYDLVGFLVFLGVMIFTKQVSLTDYFSRSLIGRMK